MAFTRLELVRLRKALYHPQPPEVLAEVVKLLERETELEAPAEPLEPWREIFIDMIREKRDLEAMELFAEYLDKQEEPTFRKLVLLQPLAFSQLFDAVQRMLRWQLTALGKSSIGPAGEDWLNLRRVFTRVSVALGKAKEADETGDKSI